MSRTIGYNPDPTPSARRDSKGRFRIEVRVMEAMLAIVGHSQCVTHARCGTCGRFLGQRSWARRQFARVKTATSRYSDPAQARSTRSPKPHEGRRVGRARLRIGLHVQSLRHRDGFGYVEGEPTRVGRAWQLILIKSLPHGPNVWTRRRVLLASRIQQGTARAGHRRSPETHAGRRGIEHDELAVLGLVGAHPA